MKTLLALFAILTSLVTSAQSIEISPNGGTTNASAILDLKSTTKGFLLPRMTNAQMRAIPSPAQGLLAFCTDCGANGDYYFYKGTAWVALGSNTVMVSTTVGPISANASPNGATITNGNLSLAPADGSYPGIVSTTAQTIAGAKTFSADINVNGITVGKGAGSGFYNTANGYQALNSNTTGIVNTANGYQALKLNTIGNANTANGSESLVSNTSGNNNTANGSQALFSNITGNNNTANGFETLKLNTTGNANTATGLRALSSNTTGEQNTANGQQALVSNTTGLQNTAIGYSADVASGDLTNATAIGANAIVNASNKIQLGNGSVTAVQLGTGTNVTLETGLVKITGGIPGTGKVLTSDAAGLASWTTPSVVDLTTAQTIAGAKTFSADLTINGLTVGKGTAGIATNTAIGISALASNTTGYQNTANGYQALNSNTTGYQNTANGYQALFSNTTGSDIMFGVISGRNNTANGFQALYSNTTGYQNTANGNQALYSNTIGSFNTANGYQALYSNTTGGNTANGYQALYSNTTGNENTANGSLALYSNITGDANTATGNQALQLNTTGVFNTATGYITLRNNTTGDGNTAYGPEALFLNTSGDNNTATGNKALFSNITGFNNTAIGYNADVASNNLTNATAIGANASVNASNKVRIGNASVTVIEGQVAWSNVSDRRLKENIQVNNYLGLNFINKLQPVTYNYISDKTKVRHDGFIAQDIEQIMKDLNLPFSGLNKSSDGMYSLAYSDFVMPLVNAVKEQQKTISELVGKTAELVKKNDSYESQILKLSSKLEEIEKRYSNKK